VVGWTKLAVRLPAAIAPADKKPQENDLPEYRG